MKTYRVDYYKSWDDFHMDIRQREYIKAANIESARYLAERRFGTDGLMEILSVK